MFSCSIQKFYLKCRRGFAVRAGVRETHEHESGAQAGEDSRDYQRVRKRFERAAADRYHCAYTAVFARAVVMRLVNNGKKRRYHGDKNKSRKDNSCYASCIFHDITAFLMILTAFFDMR